MKMFILKIHTDYGYEGTSDYNLVVSSSKEMLEELAKIREDAWLSFQGDSALDFLEIKENWGMDLSEFDIEEVKVV